MSGYGLDGSVGAFARSQVLFEEVLADLAGPGSAVLTHAELEERLDVRGRELMRQLFQDHADLRAVREDRQVGVTDRAGVEHTRVERGHTRTLTTKFGDVRIDRLAYRAIGAANLHPADARWNLPAGRHSHGLAKLVAHEVVRGSFESAQVAIERASGVRVGKRQIEDLAVAAAVDITDFYTGRRPDAAQAEVLVVLTCDAKGIVMHPDALREATAKKAAAATPRLATRLSPGEKRNRKRMAELACVYDAVPVPRTPADVIADPATPDKTAQTARDARRRRGPRATGKWLTGSVTDEATEVIATAFEEAIRRDPTRERTWVVLVDGNRHQIETIEAEAARRDLTVNIVVDFIHVAEYVWGAAWSFFDKADPDAERWVADQLTKILHGKARNVAASIRRRATTYGYTGPERDGADTCAAYLCAKANYLNYDHALAAGWPIATGVIEGACRHLVKDRLDITGARWKLPGAEAILRLRALITCGDFPDYWHFHLSREHDRNHQARYQQRQTDHQLAA
jgi:hypothetical protein